MNKSWQIFKSLSEGTLCIKEELKDTFERNFTAQALYTYAKHLILTSRISTDMNEKKECFEKALSSFSKAFRITRLPIYLFDFACLLYEDNQIEDAITLFQNFLYLQSSFRPDLVEQTILNQRNLEQAINVAKTRLTSLPNDNISTIETPAILILAVRIIDTSYKCGQAFKKEIDEKFGKDSKDAILNLIKVQYEFLFFFAHLTTRFAFAKFGNEFRTKLQNILGLYFEVTTTEAWFGHWPEKFKVGISDQFWNKLNVSEMEYSECKELLVEGGPFSDKGLFSKLGLNIASLFGNNIGIDTKCVMVSVEQFRVMELEKLIDLVGNELNDSQEKIMENFASFLRMNKKES